MSSLTYTDCLPIFVCFAALDLGTSSANADILAELVRHHEIDVEGEGEGADSHEDLSFDDPFEELQSTGVAKSKDPFEVCNII